MKKPLFGGLSSVLLLLSSAAQAACPVPEGGAAVSYLPPTQRLLTCEYGGDWKGSCYAPTGEVCTNSGETRFSGTSSFLQFCNGAEWVDVDCGTTSGACTAADEQSVTVVSGSAAYCLAGSWKPVAPSSICSGIGTFDTVLTSPQLTPAQALFGWDYSVRISGDWLAVGAPHASTHSGFHGGAVSMWKWSGTSWDYKGELEYPSWGGMGRFGQTLSIDGNRLVVGSHDPGRVITHYEYNSSLDNWEKLFEQNLGRRYMEALDIDGDRMIVSDLRYNDTYVDQGLVEIWQYDAGGMQWIKQVTLYHPQPLDNYGHWGRTAAIKGDIAVVGSQNVDVDDGGSTLVNAGRAALYQETSPGTWSRIALLDPPGGPVAYNTYAERVDVADTDGDGNGDVIVVSHRKGLANDYSGNAFVWERQPDDSWALTATLSADDAAPHDHFGKDVAIDDDGTIVVSAFVSNNAAGDDGSLYVFRKVGGIWTQITELTNPSAMKSDRLGRTVAVDVPHAVGSASFAVNLRASDRDTAGQIQAFTDEGATWSRRTVAAPPQIDSADRFGTAVAASAGYVAVGATGAPGEDAETGGGTGGETPTMDAGAVTVFMKNADGSWTTVKTIHGTAWDGRFGENLAMTPDTLAVAEPKADVGVYESGGARIFSRDEGGPNNWGEVAFVAPPPEVGRSYGGLGNGLDMSGNQLLIGTPGRAPEGTSWAVDHWQGAAYLYTGSGSSWTLVKEFLPPVRDNNQHYGRAVAVAQDTVVIGAPYEDLIATNAGAFYVYSRDVGGPGNWGLSQHITSSEGDAMLGWDVSISGDTLAVSAMREDTTGSNGGALYIYYRDTIDPTKWNQQKVIRPASPYDMDHVDFGSQIELSGDTLVVGAERDDTEAGDAGATYVYQRNQGGADNWGLLTRIVPTSPASGDRMGASVAVTGDMIVAGAPYVDGASAETSMDDGAVYVYGCPSP